ncbi:MAG: flagellin [Huintestinicola sp.]
MLIQHNFPAMFSKREYAKKNNKLNKSLEKLSSGYAINRSGDNAAGLAVSEKMRAQIFGIKQSVVNCTDGISLVQTFEGALGQTVSIIHRAKELAVQSANGTYQDEVDREAIQIEYEQLCNEADQIADTDFNGLCMLNGRMMADKFTILTDDGTKWKTPLDIGFAGRNSRVVLNGTKGTHNMSIELFPDITDKIIDDPELMTAINKLDGSHINAVFNNGKPEYSLVGYDIGEYPVLNIETNNGTATISTVTAKSGKVDIATVTCNNIPHNAYSTAKGKWQHTSVATYKVIAAPKADTPGNNRFDVSKYTEGYVNQGNDKGVTRAEREAYLQWVNDTPHSNAVIVGDNVFDEDTDPLKFTWSLNSQEYQNVVGSNGVPTADSGVVLPVYDDSYSGGPQIFIEGLRFLYDDEDMKNGAMWGIRVSSNYNMASGSRNGKTAVGGNPSMDLEKYKNIWLEYGRQNVTLTYNKAENKWYDSFGGSGTWSQYGLSTSFYPKTEYYIKNGYEARNLYHFYEGDGKLPDGFTLNVAVTCPRYRSATTSGLVFNENSPHSDGDNIIDFKLGEYDPANPDAGGVDYAIAIDGATYTYDGRIQPDGSEGVWRDSNGDPVDLAAEGIHLPTNPNGTYIMKLHDGMTITAHNPNLLGTGGYSSRIKLVDGNTGANGFRRVYEDLTFSDGLILQVGARSKDSVKFTFEYESGSLGSLESDLNCSAKGLGMDKLSLLTQDKANEAIDKLEHSLNKVSLIRSSFGALHNRLEHKIDDLNNVKENLTAAESGIRDADIAEEMMNFTQQQILSQSSQAMISQANSLPQSIIQMLSE